MTSVVPPRETDTLAVWFAEAVRAEVAELEKKGGDQRYELHFGKHITSDQSLYSVYRFTLADNTLVPEEASGTIEIANQHYKASVVAQETSRVDVQIDGAEALGAFIARALLCVDDLGLLRKLAEVLEEVAVRTERISHLATAIFHPEPEGVRTASLPDTPVLSRLQGEQRAVVEQACGSDITFIWGPPGTGKTFVIAHMIAALVARGERVLMTSHTHAAVDQSLYEAVKRVNSGDSNCAGPLANSDLEHEGKIVRVGRVTNDKVPASVRLDSIVERKSQGIQSEISELQRKVQPLSAKRAQLNAQLVKWNRLSEVQRRLAEAQESVNKAVGSAKQKLTERNAAALYLQECREEVEFSQEWQPFDLFTSWLNLPAKRVARAREALAAAEQNQATASKAADEAVAFVRKAENARNSVQAEVKAQADACVGLPGIETLRQHLAAANVELDEIDRRLAELHRLLDALEKQVIAGACVVAATLTKCYVGEQLKDESFDAVIVDEISMALPPLLFVAARHALRRVILVGDFKQLPPIVRSDNELSDERLRQDAFHLAGLAHDSQHTALTRLRKQRRMLPQIADAARHISYGANGLIDHEDVQNKSQPDWLEFLPPNPLMIVDTAQLHCWSGRQAGSLSRFNVYSAQISVELAAMAAARVPRPLRTVAKPIGIVTPYAAQRRLLLRLVEALDRSDWIDVGTVHTFQGSEAELIIFDTVLDEPYWTARLCNPKKLEEVRRDLNVALTRAKSKFVLVGSSEWLHHRARPTSGLGELWDYMRYHADLLSAVDVVEVGFADRVADASSTYHTPARSGAGLHQILDENTFFDFFAKDLNNAADSIFGLVAFFGEYRWPRVEPLFRAALERDVEVTLITPPPSEAENKSYVDKATQTLRHLGAVVVPATGLHGKDIVIDARIHYTGSLNWASHRGRAEIMHRTENSDVARMVLEYLQARHIRNAVTQSGSVPRTCPRCGGPLQVVNVRNLRPFKRGRDVQPLKLACANHQNGETCECGGYIVDIDQRVPFLEPPICGIDQRTKYSRVKRRRSEFWECPKHPKECERFKVVVGDP